MTLEQFFSLNHSLRQEYLFLCGEPIAELEEKDFYTSLFLINDFFVEVFLCKHSSEIISIIHQPDTDVHLLYIDKLAIDFTGQINKI